MINKKISVRIWSKTSDIIRELEKMVLSAQGFRLNSPQDSVRPDLLIFELTEKLDEDCKLILSLLTSGEVGEVFVTSDKRDADLLLKVMRTGAKEFLSQPLDESEVINALESLKKRMQQVSIEKPVQAGKIIDIIGAKGGVGTTTVAVNLAMILAEKNNGGSVALVDLNTVFGEIPLFLSLKTTYHWGEISKNISRLDSTLLMNAMTKHPSGVHILPSPSYLNGHPPVTPETMDRLLAIMKRTFDFVIVDGGQSLDSSGLKAIQMADRIFLITLLSLPCLRNTANFLKSLASVGLAQEDQVRLVINRYMKKSEISIKEAEESIHKKVSWSIPNDYKTTMSAINRGKPLNEVSPKAEITKNIRLLADSIIEGERVSKKKSWFFGR